MATTTYLRFANRAETLAVLGSVIGFTAEQDPATGRQMWSSGLFAGARYHLVFLADAGVATGTAQDHVNIQWSGPPETAPDFGTHVVTPATPSCVFAA